jgi:phytoene dehydrogenase-like protein
VASYTVNLLNPQVIADMGLHGHGLCIVERPIANFLPIDGAGHLKLRGGPERTQAEFARFSRRDADPLPTYGTTVLALPLLDESGEGFWCK